MPKHQLLSGLSNFLHQNSLVTRGEKVLVAVSGGLDSMVLLDCLHELAAEFHLELAVAHFNYQLRGRESDGDEEFVRSAAAAYGVGYYVERANTLALSEQEKRSVQDLARELRYKFFGKLRTSLGFQKIATAHHANDNAETILFNLFRGAGIHGLSGITPHRKDIAVIRPLLFATRDDIRAYAEERHLAYREDSSNLSSEYSRNFIRREVMPLIQEHINPNLVATLNRTGDVLEQVEQYAAREASDALSRILIRRSSQELLVNIPALQDLPVFVQEFLVRTVARELTGRELEHSGVRGILRIADLDTGTTVTLAGDAVCYRNRQDLIFTRRFPKGAFRYVVQLNKEYDFEHFHFGSSTVSRAEFSKDLSTEFVDGASLGNELALRPWNEGDVFVPLGMRESKKLSDFFIDEKIPLFEKSTIPILVSDGKIVWICGKRLDDRYKVTPGTTRIIRFEYHPRA